MPLAVDVLDLAPLPMVRLIVTGVPSGRAWRVVGSAGGYEWVAGEGISPGPGEIVFSDPWAPLGQEAGYVLRYTSSAAPVDLDDRGFGLLDFGEGPFGGSHVAFRRFAGVDVVTNLSGRVAAQIRRNDDDPWQLDPRVDFLDVPGSELAPAVHGAVAGAGGGEMLAKTTGPDTLTLRDLIRANRPVIVLHNKARCAVPGCDVPPSMTATFTAVRAPRTGRTDVAERVWSLPYQHSARPHRFIAPVVTWEDVAARFATLAELTATGMTNAQLTRGDWAVTE